MTEKWLLIWDPPLPGQTNMEKDRAIHRSVAENIVPPTLRLYRWSPPTLSLGYFQKVEELVDVEACRKLEVDIVQRPTGGRAVLHVDDLTYCVCLPESHPLVSGKGVVETYRLIAQSIVKALKKVHIDASLVQETKNKENLVSGACFDVPSAYEIQVRGNKVAGSAQLRRNGALLQHGSILFTLSPSLHGSVFKKHETEKATKPYQDLLSEKAAGLLDLGYSTTHEELGLALINSFSEEFNIFFEKEEQKYGIL